MVYSLRVLRAGELVVCQAEAHRYFTEVLKWEPGIINSDEFGEEVVRQILARAMTDEDGAAVMSPQQLRDEAYDDEIAVLWSEYVALKQSTEDDSDDPPLTQSEVAAVLGLLKKKDRTRLRLLAASTLRSCLRTMVDQLSNSATGKFDAGSSSSPSTEGNASESEP